MVISVQVELKIYIFLNRCGLKQTKKNKLAAQFISHAVINVTQSKIQTICPLCYKIWLFAAHLLDISV